MNYSYDEIYGIDLDTYCAMHDTTIEKLISKIDIDIDILMVQMKKIIDIDFRIHDSTKLTYLHSLIKKKSDHKERLYDWANGIKTVG